MRAMTNAVTIASLLASTLALSACSAPTKDGTAITLDSAGRAPREQRLTAPAGLVVTYFASGLDGVRFMAVAPDGAVYASQPGEGRVLRLADANHDGVADGVVAAVTGMNQPHGLAFHKGALYVANTDGVVRVTLGADGTVTSNAYVNRYSGGGGHWTRTIVFGADSAMYVAVGSTCNICVESSSDRAAVLRFNEDGSGKRVFAAGLRNAVGLAVEPSTGALWGLAERARRSQAQS
jgi:glucose/arabinose dehydrogenase